MDHNSMYQEGKIKKLDKTNLVWKKIFSSQTIEYLVQFSELVNSIHNHMKMLCISELV